MFAIVIALMLGAAGMASGAVVAAQDATPDGQQRLEVSLINQQEEEVGTATLTEDDAGLTISVDVQAGALEPVDHGIHVHETGSCDPAGEMAFSSAGGHFNPTQARHGGPDDQSGDAHAGDLGNLTANEDGSAQFEITTDRLTLQADADNSLDDADGSALVIHANPDDLETDPSGESGGRVICGVIFPDQQATPEAGTPVGDLQTELTVEMVDIDFNPNDFSIPANTDVTITLPNNGAAVHNFNVDGKNNPSDPGIRSGDVQPGDSATVTVNLPPGEWYYYCSIPGHEAAGMYGTITVVEQ
jgi:Cu-Zn family superoxide dismutase